MSEPMIFEVFGGLPRQGPGNDESTEKAFKMIPSVPAGAGILDIGCGVGMQTIHLAGICDNCHITATDIYQPYLDRLMENAAGKGLADRISTVCASMDELPFEDGEFDIIWAEGSIFVMGFEKGLSYWKRFLKEGGYLALTESAWFTDSPSAEALQFWQECYPDIKSIPETEKVIEAAGYTIVERFRVPSAAWWDDYYTPFEQRLKALEDKYRGNAEAEGVIDFFKKEIALFREHSDEYGYVFFVLRKKD